MPHVRLGELLIRERLITSQQLNKAIEIQKKEGGRIGEILVKLGLISEKDMVVTLAKQLGISFVTLGTELLRPAIGQELDKLVPEDFSRKNLVLPLNRSESSLTCAVFDPLDLLVFDNLKKITGYEINPVIATKTDLMRAIDEFYGKRDLIREAIKESYRQERTPTTESILEKEEELSLDKLIARAEEAPVVKLADLILRQAIDHRASDIHIEPFKDKIILRYRIDGKLYDMPPPAKHLHLPIVSRIKILAKLDIAEKRLPQDGAFTVRLEKRIIDLRVSTIPTVWGEKVVMRILDKGKVPLELASLGFEANQLEIFRKYINRPYGMVFITGPTGSGKTTTLYATLNEIKSPEKNIITVEDPVEYRFEGVNQVQVKPDIGLNFSTSLRSFLRQDPDIILVGEVRDLETAEICVRAALTGHLVFSTLHTNDAPSAVNRLIEVGVPTYLVSPSLVMIVAQRLLRKLCSHCKEAYEPTSKDLGGIHLKQELIYKSKGCKECSNTGYMGRVGIFEICIVDDNLRQLINKGAEYKEIKTAAINGGMRTLREMAMLKVEEGITSLEEALGATILE